MPARARARSGCGGGSRPSRARCRRRSGGDVTAQKALQQTLPRKDIAGAGATTFLGIALAAPDVERSLRIEQFAAVAKTLCGLPSFAAAPLFRRIRCAGARACRRGD